MMTVRDILECPGLKGSQIALVDINEERLDRMTRLACRLNQTWEAGFEITATTDGKRSAGGSTSAFSTRLHIVSTGLPGPGS